MIQNENEINKYKEINKQYLPQEYINNNWIYRYNGDYIIITTDKQCYTQYNTTYCNCINYNWKTNVMEELYQCNRTNAENNSQKIPINNITSDINYSERITNYYIQDKIGQIAIIIIAIIFSIMLLKERKRI